MNTRQKYYQKNKEDIKKSSKKYYEKNKEILKQKRDEYRKKNRDEINRKQREYRQKNRDKINKKQKEYRNRYKTEKPKSNSNYIEDNKLKYELILSQGKGKPTEKLKLMVYKICNKLNTKFSYNDDDIRYDIIMGSYIDTLTTCWYSYDKNYKSLPYVSEVVKRSQTKWFNHFMLKGVKAVYGDKIYYSNIEQG